jgi:hypothetical protein
VKFRNYLDLPHNIPIEFGKLRGRNPIFLETVAAGVLDRMAR